MTLLTTWRHVRRLAAYSPWFVFCHITLWGVMNGSALIPGLVAREIFDDLAENAALSDGANGWIALLAGLALGRAALWMIAGYVEIVLRFRTSGLLRRHPSGSRRSSRTSTASGRRRSLLLHGCKDTGCTTPDR